MNGPRDVIPTNQQHLVVERPGSRRQHTMDQVLRAFLSPLAESSQVTIQKCLTKAAATMGFGDRPINEVPWHLVDAPIVSELISRWRSDLAKSTLSLYIFAVRGIAQQCYMHGLMDADQLKMIQTVRLPKSGDRDSRGQYVKDAWLDALISSCSPERDDRRVLALRDLAMLAILFGAGLRRNEASNLAREDLDLDGGRFRVVVKGGKKAMRYIEEWAIEPIRDWLKEIDDQAKFSRDQPPIEGPTSRRRQPKRSVREGGMVLRRLSKSGTILGDLEGNGLYNALKERCEKAGVNFIRPHDARRTLATNLIRDEGLTYAKLALGHKNISTTQIYDMTDEDEMSSRFRARTRKRT